MAIPPPASTAEAVEMYHTSLRHLATIDPAALAAAAQAECLQAFESSATTTRCRTRYVG